MVDYLAYDFEQELKARYHHPIDEAQRTSRLLQLMYLKVDYGKRQTMMYCAGWLGSASLVPSW